MHAESRSSCVKSVIVVTFIAFVVCSWSAFAGEKFYRYKDADGNEIIVNDPSIIPEQYRKSTKPYVPPPLALGKDDSKSVVIFNVKKRKDLANLLNKLRTILQNASSRSGNKSKRENRNSLQAGQVLSFYEGNMYGFINVNKLSMFLEQHPEIKRKVIEILRRLLPPEAKRHPLFAELLNEKPDR